MTNWMTKLPRITGLSLVALTAAFAGGACSSTSETAEGSACDSINIDFEKEMMIVDDAVINDERAKNARADGSAGPWSFRYVIEQMVPTGTTASDFIRTWLDGWVTIKQFNGFAVDQPNEERVTNMNRLLMCPWLRRTPENECNNTCTECKGYELDLKKAPFRLSAIVNRMDQRLEVASEPHGEGRLAFSLMDGSADDPASRPLAMTIIFEFVLPDAKSTKEWAETWHELGKFPARDEAYKAALESVTNQFTRRGANPSGRNGSALGQLRTNESVFNWIWQLREFALSDDGLMRMRGVRNTPGRELDNSPALKEFVKTNADAIRSARYELPASMRAGSADAVPQPYVWNLQGVDQETSRAFNANTCNGCHTDGTALETAFHLTPFRTGAAKLSRHIRDPRGGQDQEKLRSQYARDALCGIR